MSGDARLRLGAATLAWDGGALSITTALGDATTLRVTLHGSRTLLERIEPRTEPFLPMALLVAAAVGSHLDVAEPVDPDYLVSLRLGYLPLLTYLYALPAIEVRAPGPGRRASVRIRRPRVRGHPPDPAALLYSGGVDSLFSFIRLRQVGHPLRLLLNVNAGAHGPSRALMTRRFERVDAFARAVGMGSLLIDTNFHELLAIPHQTIWPIRNLPAAFTLHGVLAGLVSSTARAFQEISYGHAGGFIGDLGARLNSSLAWARMPVTEVGYEATRYDKLRTVADEPLSYHALDVCLDARYQLAAGPSDPVNCGDCHKCSRVLVALDRMARLDRFGTQFDLERYATNRDAILTRIEAQDEIEFTSPLHPAAAVAPAFRLTPSA